MAKISDAELTSLLFDEIAAASIATPAADLKRLFVDTDGLFKYKDETGAVTALGGSGIPATIFDAKGDTIAASAADTAAKVTVGADGTVYTADSAEAAGVKWVGFVGGQVYNSAVQSIPDNTETAITLDTEEEDTDAFHSTVSNTSRVTIPAGKAGVYRFSGCVQFSNAAATTATVRRLYFRKGGATLLRGGTQAYDQVSTTDTFKLEAGMIVRLAVGEYIEMVVLQNSGGAMNVGHASAAQLQSMLNWQLLGA